MNLDLHDMSCVGLLLVDMQNDFLHPEGAYGRAGQTSPQIAELTERLAPVARAVREAGGWIVSTHFTLVPGKGGRPFISSHLAKIRPFLTTGDFAPGSWGHALVDELVPADLTVEKVAYSAFYMTRLEWVLRKAGIEQLLVGGIVTNGGVASTVRDAHVRGLSTTVLSNGCGAFDPKVHEASITDLSSIVSIARCEDVLEALGLSRAAPPGRPCRA